MSDPTVLSTGSCNASVPVCIGRVQYALFYSGLCLITVGMSGQWIGLNTFLVGQKVQSEHQLLKEESMFDFNNLTLACDPLYLNISGTAFGIQYVNPWPLKFGIPTILNVVFALLALCISYAYTPSPPRGSNLTRVFRRVFVAAVRKIYIQHPKDVQHLHKCNDDEVLLHTKFLRFLNRAAIVAPSPPRPEDQIKNKWKLCCIEEVEDTKVMIRMIPKCLPFIITGLVISVGSTFFMEQGNNMSRRLGRIKVPLVTLFIIGETASVYCKVIYECLSMFSEDDKDKKPRTQKRSNWYVLVLKYIIGIGMVFAVLCCIVAALVEKKRINVIKGHSLLDKPDSHIPMSMFWLLPQFILLGFSKGMVENGAESLFKEIIPNSISGYAILFAQATGGVGSILCVLAVYVTNIVNEEMGKRRWFADTLNESRLDYFYWTLAVLSSLNLGFFALSYRVFDKKKAMASNVEEGGAYRNVDN